MSLTILPMVDGAVASTTRGRRNLASVRETDVLALLGAVLAAVGITWLVFVQLAPFSGKLGMVVVFYLAFATMYAVLVSLDESAEAIRDRLAAVVIHTLAFVLMTGLIFVLGFVLARGVTALVHLNFYYQDLSRTGPLEPLTRGGIVHGIVGTIEQITISLVITIPLGLTCAVFLNEFRGPVPRFVRTIVEAMTALPSIIAGLFIFTVWILSTELSVGPLHVTLGGHDKSGFAAALALSIMMLPIIIRAADVVLRLVPASLKEASLALGSSQWRTIWHVTLPTARSGLATAVILGTARGIGETSPVLLTAGVAQATNVDPFNGPQVSLPLLAFLLFNSPTDTMRARALGAASTLLLLVLGLFVTARLIGGRGAGNLTKRQAAKRAEQSVADARRFVARAGGVLPPLTPWFDGVSAAGIGVSAAGAGVSAAGAGFGPTSTPPPSDELSTTSVIDLTDAPHEVVVDVPLDGAEPHESPEPDEGPEPDDRPGQSSQEIPS